MDGEMQDATGDGCAICSQPFSDSETVIQVVEDKHPTYDREVILATCHERCWKGRESLSRRCRHCGCAYRLVLLRAGPDYQNLAGNLFCPFCATLFDWQMGAEGRCDRWEPNGISHCAGANRCTAH